MVAFGLWIPFLEGLKDLSTSHTLFDWKKKCTSHTHYQASLLIFHAHNTKCHFSEYHIFVIKFCQFEHV